MNIEEAARELGCSAALVYKLCAHGRLGYSRIGFGRGKMVISPAELREYQELTRVPASPTFEPEYLPKVRPVVRPKVRDYIGEWIQKKQENAERKAAQALKRREAAKKKAPIEGVLSDPLDEHRRQKAMERAERRATALDESNRNQLKGGSSHDDETQRP